MRQRVPPKDKQPVIEIMKEMFGYLDHRLDLKSCLYEVLVDWTEIFLFPEWLKRFNF